MKIIYAGAAGLMFAALSVGLAGIAPALARATEPAAIIGGAAESPYKECLQLRGRPLRVVIAEVNRHSARQLVIMDPASEDLRIGGRICTNAIDSLLHAFRELGIPVAEITPESIGDRRRVDSARVSEIRAGK